MTDPSFLDGRGRPRVVVTGMGMKTPAGCDIATFWSTVCAGQGTAGRIQRWDPSALPVQIAGEVLDFDPIDYFGPKEVRRQDRFTHLGFAAAADALDQPSNPFAGGRPWGRCGARRTRAGAGRGTPCGRGS